MVEDITIMERVGGLICSLYFIMIAIFSVYMIVNKIATKKATYIMIPGIMASLLFFFLLLSEVILS